MIFSTLQQRLKNSGVGRSLQLLEKKSRLKLSLISAVLVLLGLIDLIGVGLVGIIGALSVAGVQSESPNGKIYQILEILQINHFSFQAQVAALAVSAVILFVGRSVLSVIFTRKIYYFLGHTSFLLSSGILRNILTDSLIYIRSKNLQQIIHSSTYSVNALCLGVIGGFVSFVADASLTMILAIALILVDPVIAISTFGIFAVVILVLNKTTQEKSRNLGLRQSLLAVETNQKIESSIRLYREFTALNMMNEQVEEIKLLRKENSVLAAEVMLLPNISKYVIETSVILGALFISALQFWFQDSRHAIASLSIFLAAGSRIAPALLRMQQGLMSIRLNLGFSDAALSIIKELDHNQRKFNNSTISKSQNSEFLIEVSNLKFRYQDESTDTIAVESLKIPKGSSVGIVGATGSGKSTFIDILMGMIPPTSGQVLISGLRPRDLLDMHPGYIGYVPQDIYIMDGTFRENITLGRMGPEIESKLQEVLRETQLDELVKSLSHGLETLVGSGGLSLSGGQKQRIGIARALLGEPSVLVLDESTSALDSESEQLIGQAIEKITSRTTVIMIAHRLSSIKSSNLVIYFENGKVRGSGTFNEVRNQISDFDKQAKLMGL